MADSDVARDFIANKGSKRPSDAFVNAAEKARTKRERKRLNRQSAQQQARQAFLAGIKAERIELKLAIAGGVCCERCAACFEDFVSAWDGLELHHGVFRSKGSGYRAGGMDFGVDDPSNLLLLCRRCHDAQHSRPMFGSAS